MNPTSLRETSIPRFAMRADEAAASCGISLSLFKRWEKEGKMPKGRKVDGVVLYKASRVRDAILRLIEEPDDADDAGEWGDEAA